MWWWLPWRWWDKKQAAAVPPTIAGVSWAIEPAAPSWILDAGAANWRADAGRVELPIEERPPDYRIDNGQFPDWQLEETVR